MISITLRKDVAVIFMMAAGKEYSRIVSADISGMAREQQELKLLIVALKRFNRPVEMEIYSGNYIFGVLHNRWLDRWEENGWVNTKGKPVRYKEQWQQVYELLKAHTYHARKKED